MSKSESTQYVDLRQKIQIGRQTQKVLLQPKGSTTMEQPSWTRRDRTIYERIREPAWQARGPIGETKALLLSPSSYK